MTTQKELVTIALLFLGMTTQAQEKKDSTTLIKRPADIGLIYPVSTNGTRAAQYSNAFSLQGLAGVSGAVTGCAVAGIANLINQDGSGAAIAGIGNLIGGQTRGAQLAGILNVIQRKATGFQAAGILNNTGTFDGAQIAGIGNITGGNSHGIQIGGLFNKAGNVHVQMAGLLNKALKVKGIQLSGMVNIADSSDYPLGFINIIKNGQRSLQLTTDESLNTVVSFRSGSRVTYGIIGVGYNLKKGNAIYELETGFGAHIINRSKTFQLNGEATMLTQTDFKSGHAFRYALSLLPEIHLTNRLSVFAGPTANLVLDYSHGKMSGIVPHYVWTTTGKNGHFIGGYFGATGGIGITL